MKRYVFILVVAIIIVILDQVTKAAILQSVPEYTGFVVVDNFFNIIHVHNPGAAFGIFNDTDSKWTFLLFSGAGLVALFVVFIIAKQAPANSKMLFIALGCILGGAVGNFIDRFRFRYVIDFLDFYVGSYHWPAFNVADIGIVIGVFFLIVCSFLGGYKNKSAKDKA